MHQPVLDGHFEHGCQLRMSIGGAAQSMTNNLVQLALQSVIVAIDFVTIGPIRWLIGWQASANRVNAKRKKLIERRMKRLQPKSPLPQQVPIESFHVPDVKNNPMALGDRPIVNRIFANDSKNFVCASSSVYEASVKVMPDADSTG
jgi:hypothetical protein